MTAAEPPAENPAAWLDDDVVELTLPADMTAARTARAFITEQWPQLSDEVLDDVRLIVTELVTNATLHGQPEFAMRMRVEPFSIDLAVLDHGDGTPAQREAAMNEDSGRGLTIVGAIADRWGVEPLRGRVGKYVWASLRVS